MCSVNATYCIVPVRTTVQTVYEKVSFLQNIGNFPSPPLHLISAAGIICPTKVLLHPSPTTLHFSCANIFMRHWVLVPTEKDKCVWTRPDITSLSNAVFVQSTLSKKNFHIMKDINVARMAKEPQLVSHPTFAMAIQHY